MFGIVSSLFAGDDPQPALKEPVKGTVWTTDLALQVKRIGSVQVSPEGSRVAFTVRHAVMSDEKSEYLTHIHVSGIDGSGATQLTRGDKSCDDPQWSPDGNWLAFLSARSGNKNLWLIRSALGEALQLTNIKSDVSSFRWSPDGRSIVFAAGESKSSEVEQREKSKDDARLLGRDEKRHRLFLVDVNTLPTLQNEVRTLVAGDFHVVSEGRAGRAGFDWSPDGKEIVFTHTRTSNADDWTTSDLSLVKVANGEIHSLVETTAAEDWPLFSPDGTQIAYVGSNIPVTWGGARSIYVISRDGGLTRKLAPTWDGFGRYSELIGWSNDGSRLFYTEAHKTRLRLMSISLNGEKEEISHQVGTSFGGFALNARRTHLGFGWEQFDRAPEAFATPVDRFVPVQVSQSNQFLPRLSGPLTEIIRWKSKDGTEIEGLLTYPVGYERTRKYPFLLVIHGGPMGVFMQNFDGMASNYPTAVFAAEGFAVLRVNVRGSSGYGAEFRHANYQDWGGGDFQDLMSGVDHVIGLGVADPERLGVMGWSYGGFMTSWMITQTKRFRAASVGAGVTNLVSFTGTADIPSFLPDYFAGEYWSRPGLYEKHSPMFHIKGVSTPTLIQHGDKDERVPLSQGLELYNALKRQGCMTQMVVYPRTPHSIEEPKLLRDCMVRNVDWFNQHLSP